MSTQILFSDLWLSDNLLNALEKKWFKAPTPIQEKIIPLFLNTNKDIIGQANTWTWKTAAFGLPILEKINTKNKAVQAIIMTPTRELAIQVADEIKSFTSSKAYKLALIYWGQSIWREFDMLERNPQIVVWTPWRIRDHIKRKSLKLDQIEYFVLDEADEMLKIGFRDEIEEIMQKTPDNKRTLLFSATLPKPIMNIVNNYMNKPEKVSIKSWNVNNELITSYYHAVKPMDKFEALTRVIETQEDFYWIIFCKTKRDVDEIAMVLERKWLKAEAVHGDIEQRMREKTLARFKNRITNILVATDVAARWIDVEWLSHVINYSLPENPEVYTHRIGRTGRAWKTWKAISLVTRSDYKFLKQIEYFTKKSIDKKPIPNGEEIIAIKKDRILSQIASKIEWNDTGKYFAITNNLLSKYNEVEVIDALLNIIYKNELNLENYKNISEENFKWGRSNNVRIFIAKWRIDSFWAKDIVNFITDKVNINPNDINDIELFDKFSYANVWLAEADLILRHFKKENPRKPVIVKAKEKWWSSRRWWSRWGYRGNNSRGGSRNSSRWRNSRWNSRGGSSRNSRWRR